MTNVFFRCVLGVPSLIILLIPNIALSCKNSNLNMAEVLSDFQYIIHYDFQHLLALLETKGYNGSYSQPWKSKHSHCNEGMRWRTNNRKSKTSTRSTAKLSQKKFRRIKEKVLDLYLCWKKLYKFTKT